MTFLFGQRILILIPHPDDEVVGCCAAILRARAQGAKVFGLYLTHGCHARETMWPWQRAQYESHVDRRLTEARIVAERLGIDIVGTSWRPARTLWRQLPAVAEEIRAVLVQQAIDQIWVPTYEGGHPDHDAINGLIARLCNHENVWEFSEYNYKGNRVCSQVFPHPNGQEQTLTLSCQEQAVKTTCLGLYASEQANLRPIGIEQESFRPLAPHDYSLPPHAGTLWYRRFWWVPLPHPDVNRVRPSDVSQAVMSLDLSEKAVYP